ncbi:MAG: PKD domain-containing protein [Anaerolineales bacterium]|nr:PKD domain-containing protein [Anaerolineales bacterium]
MKRILTILLILSLIVMGCKREPFADASISLNPAYVGEYVQFQSYSTNTDYVEWDMDDGFTYSEPYVEHYFVDPGWYDVQLKAFGTKGGVDVAVFPVEVIGAQLTVEVRLYSDLGAPLNYLLPGARVRLYPTVTDWEQETNLVVEGYTNSGGQVVFDNLSYQRYYIDVWEAFHDNYILAAVDLGFIETDMLEGLTLIEHNPGPQTTAYGLLADLIHATRNPAG